MAEVVVHQGRPANITEAGFPARLYYYWFCEGCGACSRESSDVIEVAEGAQEHEARCPTLNAPRSTMEA